MDFQGKTVLVTGAGSGIGRATALQFAALGASVGLLGRTRDELEDVQEEIERRGGRAVALVADVSDEDQMRAAVRDLVDRFGPPDVVVANAGINGVWAPIDELQPPEFDRTIAVNLRGTYLTLHFCVPHMKANGGGAIVVVSSINGTRTFSSPGASAYTATKAAQVAIVQQTALELARHHIRVNAVCPGAIATSIEENTSIRHPEETAFPVEYPEGKVPLSDGRPGTSGDVADAIVFLSSDRARHITGTPLWIDGAQGLLL
ncbi:SDR family oxidoreductase [Ciceribacter azotifigens]|uniref:SDR family oxidoreductase n=1 Tax=Ciceribacter azotifigens TaxID=2069303 RepID=UPI003A856900